MDGSSTKGGEMSKRDGGPAFPLPDRRELGAAVGMSLRDWFAGRALSVLAGGMRKDGTALTFNAVAEECYRYADAMLEARQK